ncbi:neurofilament medium polypeptide-like [Helianthus annuus]|uniref:neurofilament medium polypeptide-like n=1 Tax=Helianthus annuus TaxID=4232 RepID=UPI000B8FAA95|nr:neurofilament medium polypeptide-like [Helianthus annuus]
MKEASYADELRILEKFKDIRNEWYVKESGRRRRLATPTAEPGEGSPSKPKKKQKKKVQTMLIDEPDEDVPAVNVEKEQEAAGGEDIEINADLFTTDTDFIENVVQTVTSDIQKEKEKVIDDIEGDDVDKETTSSSSSSDDEVVDEVERERRMREEAEKEKLIKKRKRQEQEDAPYVPSPEHVSESQSTPRSRKKATPKVRISKRPQKIVQKKKPEKESQKPSTPPREPTPPQSPIHQSSPRQPTSPQHSSPLRQPTPPRQLSPIPQSTPPPQQPFFTSQDIFGTPPLTHVQPGSFSKGLPTPQDNLLDAGDFDFANASQVRNVERKVEEVVAENKRLAAEIKKVADREKLLAVRVQKLESENKELTKKVDADQTEIDILKVRVSELEEEKNRRDGQNEYFKLKNKELAAAKAVSDHEVYMLNRVVKSLLGMSVDQRFEELKVEDLRAERQAELEMQMKDKGKGVEGSSSVPEMALVPSMVTENPDPISAVSGLFEEETLMHELIGDDDEEDDEDDDDDDDEFVYSASSHSSKGDDDMTLQEVLVLGLQKLLLKRSLMI